MFQKFFYWTPLGFLESYSSEGSWLYHLTDFTFEISVGIIPYPVTFLVTDLISEIYGRKRANRVVMAGLLATLFVLLMVTLSNVAPATDWSPVDDERFQQVFGLTGVAVTASMVAYLLAQFIDIRIFHFWKRLTNGKHLWLRNNGSTMVSQFVDTAAVVGLLCLFGAIDWVRFWPLVFNGFLFKVMVAFIDTPFFYATSWLARRYFGLKLGEEIDLTA